MIKIISGDDNRIVIIWDITNNYNIILNIKLILNIMEIFLVVY